MSGATLAEPRGEGGAHSTAALARDAWRAKEAAFRSAVRHSYLVRFLRLAIPVGSMAAIALIIASSLFRAPSGTNVTLGPVAMSGTKVTMEQPRLTGFRKDAKPYEVTAVSAAQDIRKPNVVELNQISARLAMDETNSAHLKADAGVYDMQGEKLTLDGNIHVKTDTGYTAELQSAQVDLKAGAVVSKKPVRVATSEGSNIEADSLDMSDNGSRIVFEGHVRTVIPPAQPKGQATDPAEVPSKEQTSEETRQGQGASHGEARSSPEAGAHTGPAAVRPRPQPGPQ